MGIGNLRTATVLVILAAASCNKAEDPKTSCADAIGKGVDATFAKRKQAVAERKLAGMEPLPDDKRALEMGAKLRSTLTALCIEDKWSSEALACFNTALDASTCQDRLTPAQRERYAREASKSTHRSARDFLIKMEGWKVAMCKCAAGDSACSQGVLDDQKRFADEMAKSADRDARPDPAEAEAVAKEMEPMMADYTKCMTRALTPADNPKSK
jgi:hypothetical protein